MTRALDIDSGNAMVRWCAGYTCACREMMAQLRFKADKIRKEIEAMLAAVRILESHLAR